MKIQHSALNPIMTRKRREITSTDTPNPALLLCYIQQILHHHPMTSLEIILIQTLSTEGLYRKDQTVECTWHQGPCMVTAVMTPEPAHLHWNAIAKSSLWKMMRYQFIVKWGELNPPQQKLSPEATPQTYSAPTIHQMDETRRSNLSWNYSHKAAPQDYPVQWVEGAHPWQACSMVSLAPDAAHLLLECTTKYRLRTAISLHLAVATQAANRHLQMTAAHNARPHTVWRWQSSPSLTWRTQRQACKWWPLDIDLHSLTGQW